MPCTQILTSLLNRTSPATHVPNECNAGGRFFAPKYQANASWAIIEGKLLVDWAKYGKYQLAITNESPPAFEVCAATHKHAVANSIARIYITPGLGIARMCIL